MSTIARVFPRWRPDDPADIEFWVYWSKDVTLALRLSDRTLKYRNQEPPKLPGALRPTVAAAMVELAKLEDGYKVLDPLCGSGTILDECRRQFDSLTLVGSDQSRSAVAMATSRLDGKAIFQQVSLDNLDHLSGTFDRVITNLPWGRQTSAQGDVYDVGITKLLDWVTGTGLVVTLTSRRDLIEPTLRKLGARWTSTRVLVQGTWASIYVIRKADGDRIRDSGLRHQGAPLFGVREVE